MENENKNKILQIIGKIKIKHVVAVVVGIVAVILLECSVGYNSATQLLVKQSPTGTMSCVDHAGFYFKGFATIYSYDRTKDFYFNSSNEKQRPQPYHFDSPQVFHTKQFQKNFDLLVLRNGYRADSPKITFKNPRIRIGTGKPEWGAEPGKQYFVISWEA